MMDERTEQLINRKLDGELTEAESLELNRLLIRDPQARAAMEQYAEMDQQAGEVIRAVASAPAARVSPQEIAGWAAPRRWWFSFGLVSAIAAALTLAVLLSQRAATLAPRNSAPVNWTAQQAEAAPDVPAARMDYAWNVEGPRRETLRIERDVIGIWDRRSRSLYLLEADQAGSLIEPVRVNY